jgi:nucleotide-binding universal stress UspA family protein
MKILIGYDGTNGADAALDDLRRAGLPREAEALVLSAAEPRFLLSGPGSLEMMIGRDSIPTLGQARQIVEKGVERLRLDFPGWNVREAAVNGSASVMIIVIADEWDADLLVVGSHGHQSLSRFFLGSVSHTVATQAFCSTRVARRRDNKMTDPNSPVRIVIGFDGSPGAEAAVRAVASRHWPQGSEALILSGLPRRRAVEEVIEPAIEQLKAAGLAASAIVKDEEPKRLLLSEAESRDADCIFVGARGLSALERLIIGSVSTAVIMRAHCSVEIVRAR